MAYVVPNFATKKELKEALKCGKDVIVYEPGLGITPYNGEVSLMGPHYPQPHKWYGAGTMKDGKLIKVR